MIALTEKQQRRKRNERAFKRERASRKKALRDRSYLEWMASQPCCVTGEWPATTHHVRSFGSRRDDARTIRLVARLHMLTHEKPGQPCIERLGKQKFEERYGISIEAEIVKARERYEQERAA